MQELTQHTFLIDTEAIGERADVFLSKNIPHITRSYVRTLIEKELVQLNDVVVKKGGILLRMGDKISVTIPPEVKLSAVAEDLPIDIIYEDEDILVVNKPQGMVTHPAVGNPSGTLVNALLYKSSNLSSINGVIRPGIVHRLDKDTTGLLVVAKNDTAHKSLSSQIAERTARRIYIALVDGNIKEEEGVIEKPIGRCPRNRKLMSVIKEGRKAITNYRVLERFGQYTLVEFELKTGRTHQIRVHAKSINHSVVGDVEYGGSNKFGLSGQLLHSNTLVIVHPTKGEEMTFCVKLPEQFEQILHKLRQKYND